MSFGTSRPVRRALVSTAWKKLAPLVKRRDGYRCVVCGTPEVFTLTAGRRRLSNLVVGHRTPPERYTGSHNDPTNLWTLCRACNTAQGNRTEAEWYAAASGRLVELGLVANGRRQAPPTSRIARRSAVVTRPYTRLRVW